MAAGSVRNKPIHSNDREFDDLTAIKGIGPTRQQWLRGSLGVHTYQNLAALSVAEIETRLKAEGQVAARSVIEGWLVQARELAAAAGSSASHVVAAAETEAGEEANSQVKAGLVSAQIAKLAEVEADGNVSLPAGEGEWKPFAAFVVEFQVRRMPGRAEEQRTKVHYMEADKEATWAGLEGQRLCQWMLAQLAKKEQPEQEETPRTEVKAPVTPPATVEITQIRAYQPPQTKALLGFGRAGQPFSGLIKGSDPFALEVSFGLVGPAAAELTKKQAVYQAQFNVHSLVTGANIHLGEAKPDVLVEGQLTYTAVLLQATLPPGMYRLRTLVTLQPVSAVPGYLEVPLLQVM